MINPKKALLSLCEHGLCPFVSDKAFIKMRFKDVFGYNLNLDNPKTFSEKLQWLKLYDRNPYYSKLVDKYEVKKIVAGIIGNEYIIPTLGIWNSFDEIDIDSLPNQFVLKCTHDSGSIVICKDKSSFDVKAAKKKINKGLKTDYYLHSREWPYKNVKPRIIAEKYMANNMNHQRDKCSRRSINAGERTHESINDYKLMCFNGKMKCSFVCTNRFSKKGLNVTFFDRQWERLPFERKYPSDQNQIKKPSRYNEMISLAERLSGSIPFVRIDFYEIQGNLYFGEMTFFPGSGYEIFDPFKWDYELGNWLVLDSIKGKYA